MALVDVVGYLDIDKVPDPDDEDAIHRVLYFTPVRRFLAKDRTEGGKLGASLRDPDLPSVMDSIFGKKAETKKKTGAK
jgi:hypothetical protein